MSDIKVLVTVTYRDEKKEDFTCWGTPYITADGLNLYGIKSHFSVLYIPMAAVAKVEWDFVAQEAL